MDFKFKNGFSTRNRIIISSLLAACFLLYGCSGTNSPLPPTINPENGGTQYQDVSFTANNLCVLVNEFVLTTVQSYLVNYPLTSSNDIDTQDTFSYTFSCTDPYAQLPNQLQYIAFPNTGIGFTINSIVGHSPSVTITVSAQMVGGNTTLGPSAAPIYDWYYGPQVTIKNNSGSTTTGGGSPAWLISTQDSAAPNGKLVDDYVCATPTPSNGNIYYATLPNPITNPSGSQQYQQNCGLSLKVFSNQNGGVFQGIFTSAYPITCALVGIGPFVGGDDENLACQYPGGWLGTACENYWNQDAAKGGNWGEGVLETSGNLCSSEIPETINNVTVYPNATIGLSNNAVNTLNLVDIGNNSNFNGDVGYVTWRFNQ